MDGSAKVVINNVALDSRNNQGHIAIQYIFIIVAIRWGGADGDYDDGQVVARS